MKEATGELNMTVVIVIAVGILAAFFYTVIWPLIGNDFDKNSRCADAICSCKTEACKKDGMADLILLDHASFCLVKKTLTETRIFLLLEIF